MHPYNSWTEAGQGISSPWPQSPAPSILGALPYPTVSHATTLVTYYISSSGSHILNSRVIGPDGRTHYTISTDRDMTGYTTVKNSQDCPIALIEWKSSPVIEIRGLVSKQPVRSWLRLSHDRRQVNQNIQTHCDCANLCAIQCTVNGDSRCQVYLGTTQSIHQCKRVRL